MQTDSEKSHRQLIGTVALVLGLLLSGCQPVAEAAKAKLAVTAKDEAPKADDAMASVMIDSVNYEHTKGMKYNLFDITGGVKKAIGGSIVDPLGGGGAKECCMVLPKVWHSGMRIRVEWQDSDFVRTYPEVLVKELEIPRYEKPADLYVVFYPEHEVEVVVSVAEPGHPEWAGRIKQSPWNQCVADFGRKVCKRATPKLFDTNSNQGFCTYLKEERPPEKQHLCQKAMDQCVREFEDEDYCKGILWGPRRNHGGTPKMNVRFAEPCRPNPLDFNEVENEIAMESINKLACHECWQDLYLGFFFDGTNNNKHRDSLDFTHSNVARLYEAFIGRTTRQTPPALTAIAYNKKRGIFPDTAQTHLSFAFARTEWKPS